MFLATLIAFVLGVSSAYFAGSWWDSTVRAVTLGVLSMPIFWLALLLILTFALANPIGFTWFPAGSWVPFSEDKIGWLRALTLPSLSIALPVGGFLTRVVRSSVLDELEKDYVRTARGMGLRDRVIVRKNVLRNALVAPLTVLGLQAGYILGGVVLVERVFNLRGLGWKMIDSATTGDFNIVTGIAMVGALMFVPLQPGRRRRVHHLQAERPARVRDVSEAREPSPEHRPRIRFGPKSVEAAMKAAPAGPVKMGRLPFRAKLGLAWVVFVIIVAIFAHWLSPYDPYMVGLTSPNTAPDWPEHIFGSDEIAPRHPVQGDPRVEDVGPRGRPDPRAGPHSGGNDRDGGRLHVPESETQMDQRCPDAPGGHTVRVPGRGAGGGGVFGVRPVVPYPAAGP